MTLERRITALSAMSLVQRKAEWHRVFGTPVPPAFGAGLIVRAIAYRLQEKQLGGLSSAELKQLARLGRKDQRARARDTISTVVKPGTWLSRTWHGEAHQVVVLETAFEYRGERYASLTAIAKKITGANWSGPRFFGLHSPRLGKLGVTADG
jgi:hypothetical protein